MSEMIADQMTNISSWRSSKGPVKGHPGAQHAVLSLRRQKRLAAEPETLGKMLKTTKMAAFEPVLLLNSTV